MRKKLIYFLTFFLAASTGYSQYSDATGHRFSQLVQLDSTDHYVTGSLIDRGTRPAYVGQQFNLTGAGIWTNLYFYNAASKKSEKIFKNAPVLIYPLVSRNLISMRFENGQKFTYSSAIVKDVVLIMAKTDEYAKNGLIDDEDPVSMFLIGFSGENLTRVMPVNFNITGWSLSKDGKLIFIIGQYDKDHDRKFDNEDEVFYQVELVPNLSAIKPMALTF